MGHDGRQADSGGSAGGAFTAGMFDGFVYLMDTMNGTARAVFDCETIVPHIEVPVRGGMTQLMVMPRSGDRLIFGLFQAGQVDMLDVSDPEHPVQAGIVNLGKDAGPHMVGRRGVGRSRSCWGPAPSSPTVSTR